MNQPPGADWVDLRRRLLLATAPLSTGAAVIVTILVWPDSLLIPAAILLGGAAATATVVAWRLPGAARETIGRQVRIGLIAGAAATLTYDAVRYGLETLFTWSVDPFRAFTLFGQLLVGRNASPAALWVAGTAYHIINGLGFAIGYTLVVRRPGLVSAVIWGLVLETFTILLYPDWLGIRAVGEFFSMSMVGHIAYGLVLGAVATRLTPAMKKQHREVTRV
jgi:hypothetical protein